MLWNFTMPFWVAQPTVGGSFIYSVIKVFHSRDFWALCIFQKVPLVPAWCTRFHQVKSWMAGVAARSQKLSDIFGSNWSFGQMSTVMRLNINMVHEFELGMISIVDLKHKVSEEGGSGYVWFTACLSFWDLSKPAIYNNRVRVSRKPSEVSLTSAWTALFCKVARKLVKHKPRLQKENIQAIHDRAVAMGDGDPFKPDYSRFLHSAKKTSLSDAVLLQHGHLENYSHWRSTVRLKAVIKIQNIFRGKLARIAAETVAKKHAFLCAREMALEDTRQRIAAEIWKVNIAYSSCIIRVPVFPFERGVLLHLLSQYFSAWHSIISPSEKLHPVLAAWSGMPRYVWNKWSFERPEKTWTAKEW